MKLNNTCYNIDIALAHFLHRENLVIHSYSGGATKIPFLAGVGIGIYQQNNLTLLPDIIVGISSGGCTALMMALGKHKELEDIVLNLELSTFFSKNPVNKKGKMTPCAVYRGLESGSFGEMLNLKDLIKKTVSEDEFNNYKYNENKPDVLIGITSLNKKNDFTLVNLKKVSYENMLEVVVASVSIPMYTNSIPMNGKHYYDGGLMYHNAGRVALEYLGTRVERYTSIYARMEKDESIDYGFNGKYLTRTLDKVIDQLLYVNSCNDATDELRLTEKFNTKYFNQIFMLDNKMLGLYDVDLSRLKLSFEDGLKLGQNIL
jgi:hypothetical protein